jgi:phospholipid/cholesterol/gamma-HCH transport system substrate-binding protein
MHLDRRIKIQLVIYVVVTLVAGVVMAVGYIRLPAMFGVGRYNVTVELPRAAGLYPGGNVTYRGSEVGRIDEVKLTGTAVAAVLSLRSDVAIPSDLDAEVHSVSSVGEQYLALLPRNGTSVSLKDGDVIPVNRTSVPPDINGLVEHLNTGLQAIPRGNLKTVVDEGYTAVGGLGPELARFVQGSTGVIIDAHKNLDAITALIDHSAPVLDSQVDTADAISSWSARLATVTEELQTHDNAVAGVLAQGGPALDEGRQLLDRLRPTLPIVMANLVSLGDVAVAYQPNIEQILVLLPQGTSELQGASLSSHGTKQDYKGTHVDFNLNINLPPPCTTGYLPAQQRRPAAPQDYPDPPAGDVYCRVPQDSTLVAVRGARNTPCATVPSKRAPTVKMCESDEQYAPLNDGTNWKGDPNATLSGQDIPQTPPGSAPAQSPAAGLPPPAPPAADVVPPPLAVAEYDPATGSYVGPDGKVYTQSNLAQTSTKQTWQSMLTPPN